MKESKDLVEGVDDIRLVGINNQQNNAIATPYCESEIVGETHNGDHKDIKFIEVEPQVPIIAKLSADHERDLKSSNNRQARATQLATFKGITLAPKETETQEEKTRDSNGNRLSQDKKTTTSTTTTKKKGDKSNRGTEQINPNFKCANSIESINDSSYSSNATGDESTETTNANIISERNNNNNDNGIHQNEAQPCDLNGLQKCDCKEPDKSLGDGDLVCGKLSESMDLAADGKKTGEHTKLGADSSLVRIDSCDVSKTNGKQPPNNQPDVTSLQPPVSGSSDTDYQVRPRVQPPFMFAGICASLLCSVFFSLSILCLKLLPSSESLQEKAMACCFRGLWFMSLCGITSMIRGSSLKVKRDELWVNILRSVFGYFGVLCSYFSLSYISMGDSMALVFSSPVWTSILSHFILKEPLQWIQILALPASLVGIILIANPALILPAEHLPGALHMPTINITAADEHIHSPLPTPSTFDFEHRWPGIVIALVASLMVSTVYIVLKFRKSTPIQTTTFWLGFFTFFASLSIMFGIGFGHIPDTWEEWTLLFGNGFFSWLGQSVLQWAFFYEDASVLSVVRTLDVAMCFVLSSLFLEDEIYWTSVVGSIIISLVVVSIMLNNWIASTACRSSSPPPKGNNPRGPVRTGSDTSVTSITISERVDALPVGKSISVDLSRNLTQRKSPAKDSSKDMEVKALA